MRCGLFISLEGIDGAGKSEMRDFMADHLTKRGIPVIKTREPGGTPLAEEMRELLLKPRAPDYEPFDIVAETSMFFAARRQHLTQLIQPRLAQGYVVLSDRFSDSAYSYQYAKGISHEAIRAIEVANIHNFKPDHTFYLDIDVETSLARHTARGRPLDRMESEFYATAEKALEGYQQRIWSDQDRFIVIDAKPPQEQVVAEVLKQLDRLIG